MSAVLLVLEIKKKKTFRGVLVGFEDLGELKVFHRSILGCLAHEIAALLKRWNATIQEMTQCLDGL